MGSMFALQRYLFSHWMNWQSFDRNGYANRWNSFNISSDILDFVLFFNLFSDIFLALLIFMLKLRGTELAWWLKMRFSNFPSISFRDFYLRKIDMTRVEHQCLKEPKHLVDIIRITELRPSISTLSSNPSQDIPFPLKLTFVPFFLSIAYFP